MDWWLDFIHPGSGCLQQDQEWGSLCYSRSRIGFPFCACSRNVMFVSLTNNWVESNGSRIACAMLLPDLVRKICKTKLDANSKEAESAHVCSALEFGPYNCIKNRQGSNSFQFDMHTFRVEGSNHQQWNPQFPCWNSNFQPWRTLQVQCQSDRVFTSRSVIQC